MIEKIKQALVEKGYYAEDDLAYSLYFALNAKPTSGAILEGPPGTGKTFLAETTAEVIGADLVVYQCFPNTREDDLMIKLVPDDQSPVGVKKYEGIIPQAISLLKEGKKVVLLLDEWDKTRPSADAFLLDFLQRHRIRYGDYKANLTSEEAENLIVFLTSNGFREISEPLIRRLPVIHLFPPSLPIVAKALLKDHENNPYLPLALKIYAAGLKAFSEERLGKPVTIQELKQFLDAMKVLREKDENYSWQKVLFAFVSKEPEAHEVLLSYLIEVTEKDILEASKISSLLVDKSLEKKAVSEEEAETIAKAVFDETSEKVGEKVGEGEEKKEVEKAFFLFKNIREELEKTHARIKSWSRKVRKSEVEESASLVIHAKPSQPLSSLETFLSRLLAEEFTKKGRSLSYEDYLKHVIIKEGYCALLLKPDKEVVLSLSDLNERESEENVVRTLESQFDASLVKKFLDDYLCMLKEFENSKEGYPVVEVADKFCVTLVDDRTKNSKNLKFLKSKDVNLKVLKKLDSVIFSSSFIRCPNLRLKKLPQGLVLVFEKDESSIWNYWCFDSKKGKLIWEVLLRFVPTSDRSKNAELINYFKNTCWKVYLLKSTISWIVDVLKSEVQKKKLSSVRESSVKESNVKESNVRESNVKESSVRESNANETRLSLVKNVSLNLFKKLIAVSDTTVAESTLNFLEEVKREVKERKETCVDVILEDLKNYFPNVNKVTPDLLVEFVEKKVTDFLVKWDKDREYEFNLSKGEDAFWKESAFFLVKYDDKGNLTRSAELFNFSLEETVSRSLYCLCKLRELVNVSNLKEEELRFFNYKRNAKELTDFLKNLYSFTRRVFPSLTIRSGFNNVDVDSELVKVFNPYFLRGGGKKVGSWSSSDFKKASCGTGQPLSNFNFYFPFLIRSYPLGLTNTYWFGEIGKTEGVEKVAVLHFLTAFPFGSEKLKSSEKLKLFEFEKVFGERLEDVLALYDFVCLSISQWTYESLHSWMVNQIKKLEVDLSEVVSQKKCDLQKKKDLQKKRTTANLNLMRP